MRPPCRRQVSQTIISLIKDPARPPEPQLGPPLTSEGEMASEARWLAEGRRDILCDEIAGRVHAMSRVLEQADVRPSGAECDPPRMYRKRSLNERAASRVRSGRTASSSPLISSRV